MSTARGQFIVRAPVVRSSLFVFSALLYLAPALVASQSVVPTDNFIDAALLEDLLIRNGSKLNTTAIPEYDSSKKIRDGLCKSIFQKSYTDGARAFLWGQHVDGFGGTMVDGRLEGPLDAVDRWNGSLLFVKLQYCEYACGTKPEYYGWATSAQTLTTWILPLVGLVLQLPFDSESSLQAYMSVFRWLGNPISSLTAELWNLRVASRCAKFADMAEPAKDRQYMIRSHFLEDCKRKNSDYEFVAAIRDSMFILCTVNQYKMAAGPSERDFRILLLNALFNKKEKFVTERSRLADMIRHDRKKGVVVLFGSIFWFIFALAISVQAAFGELGKNSQAHNLALGVLMIWLPMLVVISIVDRNPVHASKVMKNINSLLESYWKEYHLGTHKEVQPEPATGGFTATRGTGIDYIEEAPHSFGPGSMSSAPVIQRSGPVEALQQQVPRRLQDMGRVETGLSTIASFFHEHSDLCNCNSRSDNNYGDWSKDMRQYMDSKKGLLDKFAGQGRLKWHYGMGHSCLRLLERHIVQLQQSDSIADSALGMCGNNFLRDENSVNKTSPDHDIITREESQGTSLLSDSANQETPQRGWSRFYKEDKLSDFKDARLHLYNRKGDIVLFDWAESWQILCTFILILMPVLGAFIISYNTPTVGLGCRSGGYVVFSVMTVSNYFLEIAGWAFVASYERKLRKVAEEVDELNKRKPPSEDGRAPSKEMNNWKKSRDAANFRMKDTQNGHPEKRLWFTIYGHFLSFLELANTAWLLYIVSQQTFGGYNTCLCRASTWGRAGRYLTYASNDAISEHWRTRMWWTIGTAVGCLPFAIGIFYAVLQWCLQSHLWTSNIWKARQGLYRVRNWRKFSMPFYDLIRWGMIAKLIRTVDRRKSSLRKRTRKRLQGLDEDHPELDWHTEMRWSPMSSTSKTKEAPPPASTRPSTELSTRPPTPLPKLDSGRRSMPEGRAHLLMVEDEGLEITPVPVYSTNYSN